MPEWCSPKEIADAVQAAGLAEYPSTKRRVQDLVTREAIPSRPRTGRGGGLEYAVTALPKSVQKALFAQALGAAPFGSAQGTDLDSGRGLPSTRSGPAPTAAATAEPTPTPTVRHDPRATARTRQALTAVEGLKPVLTAPKATRGAVVAAQAEALGVAASTLYRRKKAYAQGGLMALARGPRADIGKRRALISLAFDQSCPLPAAELAAIREELDTYIRSAWAAGMKGWRQIREHAGLKLQELCQARGWHPSLSECAVPRHVVEAGRDYQVLAVNAADAKGEYDDYLPSIRRHRQDLKPFEIVYGDVHPLDIPVLIEGRGLVYPKLIAWMCVATGYVTAHLILPDKGESVRRVHVAQSFAHLCEKRCIPAVLGLDNGSEYKWAEMIGGFAALTQLTGLARTELTGAPAPLRHQGKDGQPVIRKIPYNSKSSPMESFFSVFEQHYLSQIPGWVGGNRITKKTQNLGKDPTGYPGGDWLALSLDLDTLLDRYHNRPQKALGGRSPHQCINDWHAAGWRPAQADSAATMLSFASADTRRIKGGRLTWNGLNYYDDALLGIAGPRLVKVAEHDPRLAFVFERPDGGRLLCAAALEPSYGFLEQAGAEERGRRLKAYREVLTEGRHAVYPLNVVAEHRKYLDATRQDPNFSDPLVVTLSAEAEAMKAAVERQAQALVEQATRKAAPVLSQFRIEENPEVAALRAAGNE